MNCSDKSRDGAGHRLQSLRVIVCHRYYNDAPKKRVINKSRYR